MKPPMNADKRRQDREVNGPEGQKSRRPAASRPFDFSTSRTGVRRRASTVISVLALWLATCPALASIHIHGREIPVYRIADVECVSLSGLAEALDGKFWRISQVTPAGPVERYVAVLPEDSASARQGLEYVFWADSASVRLADRRIALPLAPRLKDGQLYIPVLSLGTVLPGLSSVLPGIVLNGVFDAGDTAVVRLGVRERGAPDGGPANGTPFVWHGVSRSGLEYQLAMAAECDSQVVQQLGLIPVFAGNGLVQSVHLDEGTDGVLVFNFRRPANAQTLQDSAGLVLKFWPRRAHTVKRIVLDPGHGGKDPGAVGRNGTLEKDVVLDVTLRLKARLESEGFEVLLTRDEDELVTLSDRSRLANSGKADLFVSIHANAAPNREACGFETYFLSESKTDWERTVAARENAALEFENPDTAGMTDELELILTDLAQNEFLFESCELAARIQETTVPLARVNNRGVRQANFYVLRNNYMPAVLVECGFLSNRSEEKLLADSRHRERLVDGIAKGIVEFAGQYEKRVNGG